MLVLKPPSVNVIRSMWLFRHKYHADGSLSRYKDQLVANRRTQQVVIDCDDTFSPVVKSITILTVLSLALSCGWHVHQLDVKNAFLNALERAHMISCNFSRTPVDKESKLGPNGDPILDPPLYRSLTSGLQYLTFTHPNISYVVQQICLYMHNPREPHLAALKRILRYVYGDNIPSWSSKGQHTISRSSAKAEYQGVANVVAETAWIRNLLWELHSPLLSVTLVYCDNVRILHASSRYLYANIFTKGLPSALFEEFCTSLSVRSSIASTAGDIDKVVIKNAPENHKLTSHKILKELINSCAKETTKEIIKDIGEDYFVILVDESSNASHKEHISLCSMYVNKKGVVVECFIGVVHVKGTTALTLNKAINSLLVDHSLSSSKIYGQVYDRANNMKGGLKTLILKESPSSYYIHCFVHQLQLTLFAISKKRLDCG
ncbi:ribonuclease H-like domain-containing protein [Tanacetum coccineum]